MLESSAYSIGLEAEFIPSGISLIYRGNNNDPKIKLWGMPHLFPNLKRICSAYCVVFNVLFSIFQIRLNKRIVVL
jgi:hypothetical protein